MFYSWQQTCGLADTPVSALLYETHFFYEEKENKLRQAVRYCLHRGIRFHKTEWRWSFPGTLLSGGGRFASTPTLSVPTGRFTRLACQRSQLLMQWESDKTALTGESDKWDQQKSEGNFPLLKFNTWDKADKYAAIRYLYDLSWAFSSGCCKDKR